MLAPSAILLIVDSIIFCIPVCYTARGGMLSEWHQKYPAQDRIFPFSCKDENCYLLHPLWTQAPIHCSLHPHFLATSAGQLWSAASAVPVCLSCLFPMWVDTGNSPDRSLCSHLPHVSPKVTLGLNSADRLPNVVLFCHCMAPVWKQRKVWHVRRGRAIVRSVDS